MENTVTTSRLAAATEGPLRPVLLDTNLPTLALPPQTREGTPTGLKLGRVTSAVEGQASFLTGSRFARSDSAGLPSTSHSNRVSFSRGLSLIELVSDRKHTKLNRQTRDIERLVTYRKQSATTCSNRQKFQKWTSTFLPELVQARMLSFSLRIQQAVLPEGGKL